MIRKLLENKHGPISDKLYEEAANEATRDIKENRHRFKSKTSMGYVLYVMVTYIAITQRIENKKSQKQIA